MSPTATERHFNSPDTAALRTFRIVLLAALACCSRSATAQINPGSVFGTVVDQEGAPIAGGTVTLTGASAPRTASVDAVGVFRFLRVAPGKYSATITSPGFGTVTRENLIVSVGQNMQVAVSLRLATVQESATVTSAPPLLDVRKVETGQTFSGAELTQIPTSRDIWSLVQQVPGVYLNTVNVAGNASANVGGTGLTNKGSGNIVYQVDGATITDNTYGNTFARQNGGANTFFDFSTFENVEVATGGSVLSQQTSGVTINVVTKRGTNQPKGSARYLYAAAGWQSNNTPQEATSQGLQTDSTRYIREYGGDLGGPLLKDRLWLWGAGSRQDISVNPTTAIGDVAYPETAILEPWSAKLNAQFSNSDSAALYYLRSDRSEYGVGAAPDRPPETRLNILIPTSFYKAENSTVFTADLFGAAFASYQSAEYSNLPIGGLDRDVAYYDGSYHNSFNYYEADEPQRQLGLEVSRFFRLGTILNELKFGFNYRQQNVDTVSGLPGSQNQGGLEGASSLALLSRGVHKYYKSQYWTGLLGDTLTAGSLTVAAGVRYDLQRAKNLPAESFANVLFRNPCTDCGSEGGSFPGLPEVRYHGAKDWQFRYANWQPRVSATYALGESKSTLLRASYARFADQLGFVGYYGSGTPTTNGYIYHWTDRNHDNRVQRGELNFREQFPYYGVDPASLPNNPNQIQPGFKTPSSSEVTAGVDQQLGSNFAISATLSFRNTTNLQEKIPSGSSLATYAPGGRASGLATTPGGFSIAFDEPYFVLTFPQPPTGVSLENRPGATQRYYGLDVSLLKRLSENWMLRCNVGWNSFRQHLTPASVLDPNNLWGGGQNDDGGLAAGAPDGGEVLNGSWQFNINGLYQGPWGLAFGANFFGRQGYPNPVYVIVNTGNLATDQVSLLIGHVDSYRYANVYELDFRLQKSSSIGPLGVIVAAELFNAANANTVLAREQNAGTYNAPNGYPGGQPPPPPFQNNGGFAQIIQVQSPRIFRLSVQLDF